jgi:hypothetical protein
MTTLYLLFAHLIADFVLQPKALVKWKFKSWKGTGFHALVHFFVGFLLLFPYLPSWKVLGVILAVSGAHFLIDTVKIHKETHGRNFLLYFLVDQAAHVATILAGGCFLADVAPQLGTDSIGLGTDSLAGRLYENIYIVAGLSLLVFVTYTIEIIVFQVKRHIGKADSFRPNYRRMVRRAILFTALYAAFMVFGVYKVAALS